MTVLREQEHTTADPRTLTLFPGNVIEGVMRRVLVDEDHWWWSGRLDRHGYGVFDMPRPARASKRAHRVVYEMVTSSQIPAGLDLDHLCRERNCVRPAHLEPVTRAVNLRRGAGPGGVLAEPLTHCVHGHALSGSNLVVRDGRRRCVTCERARNLRSYHRNKGRAG